MIKGSKKMAITRSALRAFFFFFSVVIVCLRGDGETNGIGIAPQTQSNGATIAPASELTPEDGQNRNANEVAINNKSKNNVGGCYGWGWGGGGGGGGVGWGWGWGGGGGGGGCWGWGCRRPRKYSSAHKKRVFSSEEDYKIGEFAQCTIRGRCRGMRLDCPLHCGGPCLYDCKFMCKAHCRRP